MVFIPIFLGITSSHSLFAAPKQQKIKSKKQYQTAEEFLDNRNYTQAAIIYKELLSESSRNADLNYKLGVCYLNIASEKDKSIDFLEKAIQYAKSKNNISMDVYFNLAKAYHANYQFKEALKVYKDLLQIILPQNTEFRNEIQRNIEMCKNGIELVKNPVNISIINLGNKINTEFSEHSPGVTADETTMVFTSRRKGTGSKIDTDGQYFEDIYITHLKNGIWSDPRGISELNTPDHDASISISADGQELYIYKAEPGNNKTGENGDIFVSRLKGTKWEQPEKLAPVINSQSKESHISISADGRTIYFSSNRPGGFGGMDVYTVTKLPNGKWGRARNLGPAINTEYDEDSPFIHPDGKTLYFSSAGHETMGGLDIFKSVNSKGRWTPPENIGYPINSTDDDIYYTPTPDGKRAYFASYRKGSHGKTDIFLIKMPNETNVGLFVLKGKIINSSGDVVVNSKLTVSRDGQVIGIYKPNAATGKFLFIVDAGKKYDIEIVAEGYRTLRTVLNIPPEFANKENHSIITLLPLTLRTKDEPDYPNTLELIDEEESKLNDVAEIPTAKDSIPQDKLFSSPEEEKEDLPIQQEVKEDAPEEVESLIVNPSTPMSKAVTVTDNETVKEKELTAPTANIEKLESGDLAFTIDLGNFNAPKPELFEKLDGVIESVGPDNQYHYTYGKFKDYKDATKAQKEIHDKGFTQSKLRILADDDLIKEKTGGQTYYTIQIMALHLSVEAEFFDNLDNVNVFKGGDGFTRYTYKKFTSYQETVKEMNRLIRMGYWDAFIRTVINDQLLYSGMKYSEKYTYTIQVMALRYPKPLTYFSDLGNVKVFSDTDGIYRYTYRSYQNKGEAINDLGYVLRRGYWDAFVRKSLSGEHLLNFNTNESENYYTIQVMALRNSKPLSYFNNLGENNLRIYQGNDGLSRYAFQKYSSLEKAKSRLSSVTKKGYLDAFTREIKWYNKN
ncbi:hypothetical protein [Labilibaculum sp.]|uniref:hypothetical protein n=1 Tax=Labilibaculum sp. TaxID=2060723 RepID=UPI0035655D68